jgi:proline iminopeptidase
MSPWLLNKAWPGSELIIVADAGHNSGALAEHVIEATDRFA